MKERTTKGRQVKKSYQKYDGKNKKGNKTYKDSKQLNETDCKDKRDTRNLDDVTSNDISWYNRSPLFPLVTRVPWNVVLGGTAEKEYETDTVERSVPGVMSIDYMPTIGWAENIQSPINRAFNQLYANIVANTTGALQMQQMDLAIVVTGIANIACHLAHAKKIMGLYGLRNSLNYYYPHAVISGCGIDYDDLVDNASKYQVQLTSLISRFNNIKIPDFSDLYRRQYSLCHNVYVDSDSAYGQIIVFKPRLGYYLSIDGKTLGTFEMLFEGDNIENMGAYLMKIDAMLSSWENSSVAPIVSGNVQRAFPESAFVHIDQFDPFAAVKPVNDPVITWQINNMRWNDVKMDSLLVTQDPDANVLICKPQWDISKIDGILAVNTALVTAGVLKMYDREHIILNSCDGDISPEFVMEATRLIPTISCVVDTSTPGDEHIDLVDCPPDLISCVTIYHNVFQNGTLLPVETYEIHSSEQLITSFINSGSTSMTNDDFLYDLSRKTKLVNLATKWRNGPGIHLHPIFAKFAFNGDIRTVQQATDVVMAKNVPCDVREYNVFTYLHQDALEQLHFAAAQSLYWADGIPKK